MVDYAQTARSALYSYEYRACANEQIYWGCKYYTAEPGLYVAYDTVHIDAERDSISRVFFHIYPSYRTDVTKVINQGESLTWLGRSYTEPGIYCDTLSCAATGCDSIFTLALQVYHHTDSIVQLVGHCAGENYSFRFYGRDTTVLLPQAEVLLLQDTVEVIDPTVADTIRHLTLRLPVHYYDTTTVYALHRDLHYEHTETIGDFTFYDSPSCDTTHVLFMHVIAPMVSLEYDTICHNSGSYVWSLHPLHTLSTLTPGHTMLTDSVAVDLGEAPFVYRFYRYDTLHLQVKDTFATYLPDTTVLQGATFSLCGSSISTLVPRSESLMTHLVAANGCDSVVRQNLCISPYVTETYLACYGEPYHWHGLAFGQAADTTIYVPSPLGCDSVLHLVLTFTSAPVDHEEEHVYTAMLPYVWRGQSLAEWGVYHDTIWSEIGCITDLFTLYLHDKPTITTCDTVCPATEYFWQEQTYTSPSSWLDPAVIGRVDSLTYYCQLELSSYPQYLMVDYDTIAQPQSMGYHWRQITISSVLSAGDYTLYDSLLSVHGCDSVYVRHIVVRPTYIEEDCFTLCDNESLTWEGHLHDNLAEGIYYDTVWLRSSIVYEQQPAFDSVRTLVLTVLPTRFTDLGDTIICPGDVVTIGGMKCSGEGTHDVRLTTRWGCDSIVRIHISHFPTYDISALDTTICYDTPILWENSIYSYSNAGVYQEVCTLRTMHGCDSIRRMQVHVERLGQTPTAMQACMNDEVIWTRRRPISATASEERTKTIHTPSTPGLTIVVDTITSLLGCTYYDTLYLTTLPAVQLAEVTAADLCPEEGQGLALNFSLASSTRAYEYSIHYSEEAKAQGFIDVENASFSSDSYIDVPLFFFHDYFPQAGTYSATLFLSNGICLDTMAMARQIFHFNVLYPSWFAEQHWNDMMGVLSPQYTANMLKPEGYIFVDYQWFKNGEPIQGAKSPMLYRSMLEVQEGAPWTPEDEIQVLLTDETGHTGFTCPIHPKIVRDYPTAQDHYFALNATVVSANAPSVVLYTNTTGHYKMYNLSGIIVAEGVIKNNGLAGQEISVPPCQGTYLLQMQSEAYSSMGELLSTTQKIIVH